MNAAVLQRAPKDDRSGIRAFERKPLSGSHNQPFGLETDNPNRLKSNVWRTDKHVSTGQFHDLKIGVLRREGVISHRLSALRSDRG
jgi:hypothetical protein